MRRLVVLFIGSVAMFFLAACCYTVELPPVPTRVTVPSSIPELAAALSDPREDMRFSAAQALADMGPAATPAVPELVRALSDHSQDVRAMAAQALGEIGPDAQPAVPALVYILRFDEYKAARVRAAEALGKIGPSAVSAVPDLAEALNDTAAYGLSSKAAYALSKITGNQWPDSDGDGNGFSALSDDGELLIVIAAREWWNSEGQYQDWANSDK